MAHALGDHPLRSGLPLFLFAGLCLTSLDTTAKYLVRDHSLFLVVRARYAGQMLVVTPWAWHRGGSRFWYTRRLRLQLLRSAFLLAATLLFFGGLRFLPLAEGSAIALLWPVFVVLLAQPVLGERPTRARTIASLVGFAGILIMLRPGSAVFHPAVALLIGAALCNAFYHMLTRKVADDGPHASLFYSALVGTVAMTLMLPWGASVETLTLRDDVLLLLLGLLAGIGHWSVIAAYTRAPASMLTPYTYLQTVWAIAYGYAVFGQVPDGGSALGMAVIVASGVLLALQERRYARGR